MGKGFGYDPIHPMSLSAILNNEDSGMSDNASIGDDSEYGSQATPPPTTFPTKKRRGSRKPRPPCKKYTKEQALFIWYHRTDLAEGWDDVERRFDRQFHDKREKGGLQCKFYRVLEEHDVQKVRDQARSGPRRHDCKVGKFGVVQRTSARFPWMRPIDQMSPPLPCFARPEGCGNMSCTTCGGTTYSMN